MKRQVLLVSIVTILAASCLLPRADHSDVQTVETPVAPTAGQVERAADRVPSVEAHETMPPPTVSDADRQVTQAVEPVIDLVAEPVKQAGSRKHLVEIVATSPSPAAERMPLAATGPIPSLDHGDTSLEEKIAADDIVVRATMRSLSSEVVADANSRYRAVLKFNLSVSEYLKGTGPSSVVAVWVDGKSYDTNDEADRAKAVILAERDDQWDGREAIIFLFGGAGGPDTSNYGLHLADHFLLALGDLHSSDDRYSLHSKTYRHWLPAVSAASSDSNNGSQEFLLDVPPATGTAPTITLGDLKSRIAEVAADLAGGDGSEAYTECVKAKYGFERRIRYFQEVRGEDYYDKSPRISMLEAGQPAWTVLHERNRHGFYPDIKPRTWLEGRDAALFSVMQGETTPYDRNRDGVLTAGVDGIRYSESFLAARPLPNGEYEIDREEVWRRFLPCNYVLSHEWTVTVNAPEGVLHEAFFDPVTDGTAVAADDNNGVLKPSSFTDTDGTSATIERIAWEPGTVKLELDPHTGIAGHIVDFIALDGSVPLSLKVADATADAANDTLSWSVASQPWHDGDELMLRVREVPDCSNGTVVPNPSANPALKRDCINLLAAKDTLRGTATLNWSEDTAITSWDGVRVKGSPGRVAEVLLTSKGLTGTIPPDLGRLDGLQHLWFNINQLAGAIPSELGSLADLQTLILNDNRLTGAVPRELGGLSSLEVLWLDRNRLSGEIPAALGDLSSLRRLTLSVNRLSGSIPSDLGNLTNLEYLWLNVNRLTGTIPSELGSLDDLRNLRLGSNQLTGCIPPALRDVDDTDLDNLGLQNCPTP